MKIAGDNASDPSRPTAYAWYVGCMMMLVSVISMLDRKALVMLTEPIKRELGLSDAQLGLLTGGLFTVVYAVGSFPLARLADRFSRVKIIGYCLVVWSALTAAGGLATNFATLAGSRIGVALGEAGAAPASYALLTNYFPARARGRAYGLIVAGAPLGILLGLLLGGVLGDRLGWREALMVIGLPGAAVGFLLMLTVRDTASVGTSLPSESSPQPTFAKTLRWFMADPVLRNLVFGAGFLFVSVGATNALFAAYLMRRFAISATAVGTGYGLVLGLSGFVGALIGGWLTDKFGAKRRDLALSMFAATLILVFGLTLTRLLIDNYVAVIALVGLETALASAYAAPTFATLQSRVDDRERATATAIMLFGINGVGASIGPLIAGAISDFVAAGSPTSADTLRVGLLCMAPTLLLASFFYARSAQLCKPARSPAGAPGSALEER